MSTSGNTSSGPFIAIVLAVALLGYLSGFNEEDEVVDVLVLVQEGRFEEALTELDQLRLYGLAGAEAVQLEAVCLLALGEQPKAVRALQVGIDAFPEDHGLSVVLAEIYLSLGQARLALPILLQARERGAPDQLISMTLAVCHGHSRSFGQALAELDRAQVGGAHLPDVNYNRSLILMEEGRIAEAKLVLEEVLEQSEEHLEALREHARALVMTADGEMDEQLEQAISQLNQVIDLRSRDWRAYEVLGDAFLAQADPMAAVAAYTEALRYGKNPTRVEDKFREAAMIARERFGEAVDVPGLKAEKGLPPLPPSLEDVEDLIRGSRG